MKSMNWKSTVMALTACTVLFTACEPDDPTPGGIDNGVTDGTTLSGIVTSDVTLKAGNTYKLSGEYVVEAGATLTIEEGVKIVSIYDDIVDYILIKQGACINAVGTAERPIVMTSEKEEAGAWGGIHICGFAHTNAEGGKGCSEIGGAEYGGDNDADNSGMLRYVRVEYTGYAFDEEHEANGITFYGVGDGTTIEYCEAYKGSDDGFEFFGGSVNVTGLVAVNCSDDSFDWTEGWNGHGTDLVAYQENEATLGYDCDCLIEADNNENNYSATPISHPVLKNIVLVGNGGSKQGVRLRRGTQVSITDAIICGKEKPLAVESTETENALKDGKSTLKGVKISAAFSSKEGIYTEEDFLANESNSVDTELHKEEFENIKASNTWMAGSWTK